MSLLATVIDPGALLAALARTSLAGAVAVAAVALACRLGRGLPPALRAWLWWAACLKLIVGLSGVALAELPLLPAPAAAEPALMARTAAKAPAAVALPPSTAHAGGPPREPLTLAPTAREPSWGTLLAALWLAGVAVGAGRIARQLVRLRRINRRAEPLRDAETLALLARLARRLDLRRTPALLTSEEIATPLVTGGWRPRILLPAGEGCRLSRADLAMVLCHELAHVARRDLALGAVPALARLLFFFHPLALLAAREHTVAREAACDAAVLRTLGAAPGAYGRLLLRWGVAPPRPGLTAAGAAASLSTLKRRLLMLTDLSANRPPPRRVWLLAGLVLAALIPLRIVAQAPAEAPRAASAPAAPPAAPPMVVAAAIAEPAAIPLAAAAASGREERGEGHHRDEAWVFIEDEDMTSMHGSSSDYEEAKRLWRESGTPLLWARYGGTAYVVRDAATLERVERIFAPQKELGRRQGELGREQGELGRQQGELGRQQGELGRQQARLGAEMGTLSARLTAAALAEADDPGRRGAASGRAEIEARIDELAERMRELGARQGELGSRQGELGARQGKLGERQSELGEQQRAASEKAAAELRVLLREAIASGAAQRLD